MAGLPRGGADVVLLRPTSTYRLVGRMAGTHPTSNAGVVTFARRQSGEMQQRARLRGRSGTRIVFGTEFDRKADEQSVAVGKFGL
jgi:hypothetical protein